MQAEDEYMISDFDLFVTKYVSVPKDMGQLNCAAFIAGIVKGALDGAGFPARCAAKRCHVEFSNGFTSSGQSSIICCACAE